MGRLILPEKMVKLVNMTKETRYTELGVKFVEHDAPNIQMGDNKMRCVIKETKPGTKFYNFFNKGDQIIAINGTSCTDPMTAEKQLKELVGNFNVNVLRASPPSSAVHAKAAP
jgi:hypothetical protein